MSTTIKLASGYRHNGVLIIKSAKKAYKWAVVDRILFECRVMDLLTEGSYLASLDAN